jgi:predicted nucleic acid-binding protein
MQYALADTGIWYAMFDPQDQSKERQIQITETVERLELFKIILPWPTLYETLRTKMVKNKFALQRFKEYLKRPNLNYLDDTPYRDRAMELVFSSSLKGGRSLSMIDCLIRLILDDDKVKITCLATLNIKDFSDVCRKRKIEII